MRCTERASLGVGLRSRLERDPPTREHDRNIMEIERHPTVNNPAEWFTGDVRPDPVAAPTAPGPSAVWDDHVTDSEYQSR